MYDMAELPDADLRIGLRQELREAFVLPGLADEARGAKLRLGLAGPPGEFPPQEDLTQHVALSLQRAARLAEDENDTGRSAGADGVLLEAGPSWNPEVMALEPSERRPSRLT